jgi:hypothetical protein
MGHIGTSRIDGGARSRRNHGGRRGIAVAAAAVLATGALATPAMATGPSYPGETLSVALSGPSVAGQETGFVASGQQTDVDDDPGGFDLDVFIKDPTVDPTCSPSYSGEQNNYLTDPTERLFVVGDWEGLDSSFSVPFQGVFQTPATWLMCAYSEWGGDTAASVQLSFTVAPATPTTPVTPPPTTPTAPTAPSGSTPAGSSPAAMPVNTSRPRITRAGQTLRCIPGTWSNSPTSFAYRWLSNGRAVHGATGSRLKLAHTLKGHRVRCGVTATNSVGGRLALSAPVLVR